MVLLMYLLFTQSNIWQRHKSHSQPIIAITTTKTHKPNKRKWDSFRALTWEWVMIFRIFSRAFKTSTHRKKVQSNCCMLYEVTRAESAGWVVPWIFIAPLFEPYNFASWFQMLKHNPKIIDDCPKKKLHYCIWSDKVCKNYRIERTLRMLQTTYYTRNGIIIGLNIELPKTRWLDAWLPFVNLCARMVAPNE